MAHLRRQFGSIIREPINRLCIFPPIARTCRGYLCRDLKMPSVFASPAFSALSNTSTSGCSTSHRPKLPKFSTPRQVFTFSNGHLEHSIWNATAAADHKENQLKRQNLSGSHNGRLASNNCTSVGTHSAIAPGARETAVAVPAVSDHGVRPPSRPSEQSKRRPTFPHEMPPIAACPKR